MQWYAKKVLGYRRNMHATKKLKNNFQLFGSWLGQGEVKVNFGWFGAQAELGFTLQHHL